MLCCAALTGCIAPEGQLRLVPTARSACSPSPKRSPVNVVFFIDLVSFVLVNVAVVHILTLTYTIATEVLNLQTARMGHTQSTCSKHLHGP